MSRRVNNVDPLLDAFKNFVNALFLALRPTARRRCRGNRDAPFALLVHPIGDRGAFVHLAHLVNHAGVKKHPLGDGRLAGVDVRCDADVSRSLQRKLAIRRVRIFRACCGGFFLFECSRHGFYQRKCANARFACAIL